MIRATFIKMESLKGMKKQSYSYYAHEVMLCTYQLTHIITNHNTIQVAFLKLIKERILL